MNQIVVIGTSAGGIEALRQLFAGMPADFPAPVCVVMHTAPQAPGVLHEIIGRATRLSAISPRDREPIRPGHIYVAPPDCHLIVEPGRLRVTKGPRENRFRPAVDPLFRSAAQVYGPAAIGVVLTGNLDDGTAGLWTIKQLGGTAIVQDPDDAMFPAMPYNAMTHVQVDYTTRLDDMAALLVRLTADRDVTRPAVPLPRDVDIEVKIAKEENAVDAGVEKLGTPSSFACPDCHGVLLQLKEGNRIRFRCHTGHAYSVDSLIAAVSEGIEHALWNSVRTLEEASILMRNVAAHLTTDHNGHGAERLLRQAEQARRDSDALRTIVSTREPLIHGTERTLVRE